MKQRHHCQSFTVRLADGSLVSGRGQFVGPITERDMSAIREVAERLKTLVNANGSIDLITLTKVGLP